MTRRRNVHVNVGFSVLIDRPLLSLRKNVYKNKQLKQITITKVPLETKHPSYITIMLYNVTISTNINLKACRRIFGNELNVITSTMYNCFTGEILNYLCKNLLSDITALHL